MLGLTLCSPQGHYCGTREFAYVRVNSLYTPGALQLDSDLIMNIFNIRDRALILNIPLVVAQFLITGIGHRMAVGSTQSKVVTGCNKSFLLMLQLISSRHYGR